jgi:hypothetical protein
MADSTVNRRHVAGAVLGAFAAWFVILAFLSLVSAIYGNGWLAPFEGSRTAFGFDGAAGLWLLLLIDLVIPFVAACIFVVALAILSRTEFRLLGFQSRREMLLDGLLLGLAVFGLFYVPVLFQMAHPSLAAAVTPLAIGLIDHLAFGVTIVAVIFRVGGPVEFRTRAMRSGSS